MRVLGSPIVSDSLGVCSRSWESDVVPVGLRCSPCLYLGHDLAVASSSRRTAPCRVCRALAPVEAGNTPDGGEMASHATPESRFPVSS